MYLYVHFIASLSSGCPGDRGKAVTEVSRQGPDQQRHEHYKEAQLDPGNYAEGALH